MGPDRHSKDSQVVIVDVPDVYSTIPVDELRVISTEYDRDGEYEYETSVIIIFIVFTSAVVLVATIASVLKN